MPRPDESAEGFAEFLREETTGGKLLLVATAVALLWANLAEDSYQAVWDFETSLGPGWLHLDLTLGDWAADGLLAIFFFVAGIEIKRELTVGELADRRAATLPIVAAVAGMAVPALVVLAVSAGGAAAGGAWAIPVATDIAFALGVLALAGVALPSGVRVLLLSIAVLDDLLAIALIAILFTSGLAFGWLAAAGGVCLLYRLAFRGGHDRAWILWALGVAVWVCVHASGVHATVAGIALGLLTPVAAGERFSHVLHPVSAGIAVPVFALAAAGISLAALGEVPGDGLAAGIFLGLLVGKTIGIFGGSWLAVRGGLGSLPEQVRWGDVLAISVLGGIGYTVALLIARLSLEDAAAEQRAAAAVLAASVTASIVALFLLRRRSRAPA